MLICANDCANNIYAFRVHIVAYFPSVGADRARTERVDGISNATDAPGRSWSQYLQDYKIYKFVVLILRLNYWLTSLSQYFGEPLLKIQ